MKRSFLIFAILMFISSFAFAETILITTGGKGGSYYKIGLNLARQLTGRGFNVQVKGSKGSWSNIKRIHKGYKGKRVHIGLTQLDALALYMKQNPAAKDKLTVYGNLGDECAFLAIRKKGRATNEDDFQSKTLKPKVAIGKNGSGPSKSWDYMRKLEPGYKASEIVYKGGIGALAQLKSGQIDGVFFVTSPINYNHAMIRSVNNNADTLEFVDIDDSDLNDKFQGKPVYRFKEIATKKGMIVNNDVDTICTQGVVIVNQEYDNELEDEGEDTIGEAVADITMNYLDQLTRF